ncbi:MAG: 50S ribosomal protein L9 [Treponema sp.]|nr:50S ribosomal protein L9 [Treponema sp.]
MKIILNDDVKYVGEMGDVKNVADGYYRNYLFPRGLAVPYNKETVAYFEGKKAEIEARKEKKRAESKSLKEKLEAMAIELTVPAAANGKLFGAVTNLTLANYFTSKGEDIERKRIEIPGLSIKSVGSYTFKVHLYEGSVAEVNLVVKGQDDGSAKEKDAPKEKESAKEPAKEETKAEEKAE